MKRVAFILAFISIAFTSFSQHKPNYYFGHNIISVDKFQHSSTGDTIVTTCPNSNINEYVKSTNAKYVSMVERVPEFNTFEEAWAWYSDCREYQVYCLGDIVVNYDPSRKEWHYEMIDFKLNHYEWSDNRAKRRVEERIIDKDGHLIRYYDVRDLENVICVGKGCK